MQLSVPNGLDWWEFINDCRSLHDISLSASKKIISFLDAESTDYEVLFEITSEIKSLTDLYSNMVRSDAEIHNKIEFQHDIDFLDYNYEIWKNRNKLQYDDLLHCIRALIFKLLKQNEKKIFIIVFRLISSYNTLVALDLSVNVDIMYASSSSSLIVQNKKKFTITRILKILASSRAEECAVKLMDFLMKKFSVAYEIQNDLITESEEKDIFNSEYNTEAESDSTSIVLFKTLTQYTSPSRSITPRPYGIIATLTPIDQQSTNPSLFPLIEDEENNLDTFFSVLVEERTDLLHENEIKVSKKSSRIKLRTRVRNKMLENYEHILWENVGLIGEHMMLWWMDDSLGRKNASTALKFKSWLQHYQTTENIPVILQPTFKSLLDCLCCYVTTTSWDELFRQASISAGYQHSRHEIQDIGLGTKTGHLFCDLLHDLVFLVNGCENYNQDMFDYETLPIAEQITVLHRLDHSIHMARSWSLNRAKNLSNSWNMEQFFRVTHVDVNASVFALSQLKLTTDIRLPSDEENPHFTVCSKMRMKIISEVKGNVEKFQDVPRQSVSILASACRILSLAYLKISFPNFIYWQQQHETQHRIVSDYVAKYLDEILKPVLTASQNLTLAVQKSISKLVLDIVCEAWLSHIYNYRIKFSEWGAIQLLTDFEAIPDWIQKEMSIEDDIRQFLRTNEILRRCEGVAKLLLRHPGETIIMNSDKSTLKDMQTSEHEVNETLMPPEMYVPNQEKWLQLRLNKRRSSKSICC